MVDDSVGILISERRNDWVVTPGRDRPLLHSFSVSAFENWTLAVSFRKYLTREESSLDDKLV